MEDSRHILVRQSYPFKTKGVQACEAARKIAMTEVSRVINSDGTVIKTNTDGTVTVSPLPNFEGVLILWINCR
jgi:hypothetical protein